MFVVGLIFVLEVQGKAVDKVPLGFEVTGAMGAGMKRHVKQMLKKYQQSQLSSNKGGMIVRMS